MPKGHRSVRSQHYYRDSPATTPTSQYAPISLTPRTSTMPNDYYNPSSMPLNTSVSMSQQSPYSQPSSAYSVGGPVQLPLSHQQTYSPLPPAPVQSIRPSSGAWNPQDDQTLMAARAQGQNWAPIQQTYFPNKTPNACRKRHERLMERRSADDWDVVKLDNLAKNYMGMRREIWQGLAEATGEKWSVVEQKVCSPSTILIYMGSFTNGKKSACPKVSRTSKPPPAHTPAANACSTPRRSTRTPRITARTAPPTGNTATTRALVFAVIWMNIIMKML
jgi:hypothetical protein